jgi:hypothetical protein
MNLGMFLDRAQEIETAIANVTNQFTVLQGQKAEVAHWIEQLKNPVVPPVPPVEPPLASSDETPVE